MPEGYVDFLGIAEDASLGEVVRLRFNYYSEEDDSFYKGVELEYPWNSERLSSHVSASDFASLLGSKASDDYGLQQDLFDYIYSGRDESLLPGVLNGCKAFCAREQASVFSEHEDEIAFEVENQSPVVQKSLVDYYCDIEKDIPSRIVVDELRVGLGDEPVQRIDFIGNTDDGLKFRLNYIKDGHLCAGLPVCIKGITDAESQQGFLYRIDTMMDVDGGVLNDQLAYYCENRSSDDKTVFGIAGNSYKSLNAALFDMANHYSQEKERFHQYDVIPEETKGLVDVKRSPGWTLLVSLNYKANSDLFLKGVELEMDRPEWCKTDKDIGLFRDCLVKRYAEGNYEDLYRQVANWAGGHDTIDAVRKDAKAGRGSGVFESVMEQRRDSLLKAGESFLSEVEQDFENESLFSRMKDVYGSRDRFVDIVRSDDDSVTLRFNYRHKDSLGREQSDGTDLSPVQSGVLYTMPWYGADSPNLVTKARFIELLEEQFEKDTELQERICRYNLSRFRNGEKGADGKDDVRLRMDDDGRSAEMAAWLREFELDLKYRLPQLRKERLDKEEEENKVLRSRYDACYMALEEDKVNVSKLGTFGKFRMIIFHYDKWKEQEQHREELKAEFSVLKKQAEMIQSFGGASVRSGELMDTLQKVHVVSPMDTDLEKSWKVDNSEILDDSIGIGIFKESTDKLEIAYGSVSVESVPEVVVDAPKRSSDFSR